MRTLLFYVQGFGKLKYQRFPYNHSTFLASVTPPVLMGDDDYEGSIAQSQDGSVVMDNGDSGSEDVSVRLFLRIPVCCL